MKRLAVAMFAVAVAGCGYTKEEQAVIDASLAHESERKWEQISWAPNFEEGRRLAIETGKPLFVVLVVNVHGEPHAEHC